MCIFAATCDFFRFLSLAYTHTNARTHTRTHTYTHHTYTHTHTHTHTHTTHTHTHTRIHDLLTHHAHQGGRERDRWEIIPTQKKTRIEGGILSHHRPPPLDILTARKKKGEWTALCRFGMKRAMGNHPRQRCTLVRFLLGKSMGKERHIIHRPLSHARVRERIA